MKITEPLADFFVQSKLQDFPAVARETANLCLMDWLAVTLAGCREPLGDVLNDLFGRMGGEAQASIVGRNTKTSVLNAALINGSVSHALDYDDVHLKMLGHPTVPVAPAVFALGEWKGLSGGRLLEAFCLGVEAECRIAAGLSRAHYTGGFHATGTVGTIGAAVASAKLLDLDREKTVHALGLAGTQAAGLRQAFGTMAKPFHAGKAAMNGLLAALLAERGFTCATDLLEGPLGFLAAMSSQPQPSETLRDLGERFEVADVQFKWHAACFQTHPAIDAVLALPAAPPVEKIDRIIVTLHPTCRNVANIPTPFTGLEGKFCIPFCIALALVTGRTDEGQFSDEMVRRPEMRSVLSKVDIVDDESLPSHLGRIEIVTEDGERISAEANTLELGQDPGVRKTKVREKFLRLTEPVLGREKSRTLFERIKTVEVLSDVSELAGLWSR